MNNREIATKVALSYLGTPYRWGGDDPAGYDCSGFVIEILKSAGRLPRHGDWTASDLYHKFSMWPSADPFEGALVFWENRNDRIIHVEYCLNEELSIGASGGGRRTDSVEDAWAQNAYIKVRPIYSRSRVAGFCDPWRTV